MADLLPLERVLNDKLFVVADYQRPYAWQEKQLHDLWEDLDLLGREQHHYAGTLVLRQASELPQRTQAGQEVLSFEIVDGQQRLTTSLILLEQLRRRVEVLAKRTIDEGLADDLAETTRDLRRLITVSIGGVTKPRLTLGAELDAFFRDYVLGDEVPYDNVMLEGQRRLLAASRFFAEQIDSVVAGVSDETAARRLIDLRARACFQLGFLVYSVTSVAEVGVLFETLNERGQSLSELEKVKNYLLYMARQLPDARQDELVNRINTSWSTIFSNLANIRVSDDALLRSHWLATRNPNSRAWRGTTSVKEAFPRSKYVSGSVRLVPEGDAGSEATEEAWQSLYDDVTDYVRTLAKSSAFMLDLYTPDANYASFDRDDAARTRRYSAALARSGNVANFTPLLLAARLSHPEDGRLYAEVVELSEKFSARAYAICALRSNAGQPAVASAAYDLYQGADPRGTLDRIAAKLWWLAPDDAVRANFGPQINWYDRRSHKYVLYEYELALSKNTSDLRPFSDFRDTGSRKTTEHVLPQNPAADSDWWDYFDRDEHRRLLNGVGNLVLTYDNSYYSNHEYSVKRGAPGQETPRCFFSLPALAREHEIAQRFETWTPEAIEQRRLAVMEWALQRWSITPPSNDEGPQDDEIDELLDDAQSLDDAPLELS